MSNLMRVRAEISLENLIFNLESMHSNIAAGTKMMAVIKTNAYGHGAVKIANHIEDLDYLFGYAVATVDEAIELRKNGIKKPILILGFTFPESYPDIVKYDLRPAVFKLDMAKALSDEAVKQKKTVQFHIKTDTGMSRIGFVPGEEALKTVLDISKLENVELEGIFTHFAKADMTDKAATLRQLELFNSFIRDLKEHGISFKLRHASNSAGIIRFKEANLDMVRAGITLYGLWPSDETERDIIALKPLMSIKSHIAYIKEIPANTAISYGGTYISDSPKRIATIPVGYGDGYPRSLSNKGYVLINGKKAPITGRVCMDQFMVDVTKIEEARELMEVTLLGEDNGNKITMEELGELSGRFNYELACDFTNRVPRVYCE